MLCCFIFLSWQDLFQNGKGHGGPKYADQCIGNIPGRNFNNCGAGDIARITKPATIYISPTAKGPQVVAQNLFSLPEGLSRNRKRKGPRQDSLHVMPSERKKKAPAVSIEFLTGPCLTERLVTSPNWEWFFKLVTFRRKGKNGRK